MDTMGTHVLFEFWGCDVKFLATPRRVEEAIVEAVKATGATVVKTFVQKFGTHRDNPPAGVSGVVVLAESHLSIHTWPEYGYASVDVYTCGTCRPLEARDVLVRSFRARTVESLTIARGLSEKASLGPADSVNRLSFDN